MSTYQYNFPFSDIGTIAQLISSEGWFPLVISLDGDPSPSTFLIDRECLHVGLLFCMLAPPSFTVEPPLWVLHITVFIHLSVSLVNCQLRLISLSPITPPSVLCPLVGVHPGLSFHQHFPVSSKFSRLFADSLQLAPAAPVSSSGAASVTGGCLFSRFFWVQDQSAMAPVADCGATRISSSLRHRSGEMSLQQVRVPLFPFIPSEQGPVMVPLQMDIYMVAFFSF